MGMVMVMVMKELNQDRGFRLPIGEERRVSMGTVYMRIYEGCGIRLTSRNSRLGRHLSNAINLVY